MITDPEEQVEIAKHKVVWKWKFTVVLLANAVYIYLMYLLMNHFA